MRKRILKVAIAIVIIVTLVLIAFPEIPNDISLLFLSGPPSPKSDVPITYSIGWWNNQNELKVNKLESKIIESKLSLFNDKSLFQYSISGILCNNNGKWRPQISKAHFAERYIKYDPDNKIFIGEITITPIVKNIEDDSYKGDSIHFKINLQEVIQSANQGECKYIIKCSDFTDTLLIRQHK